VSRTREHDIAASTADSDAEWEKRTCGFTVRQKENPVCEKKRKNDNMLSANTEGLLADNMFVIH
jgi:hypothetical protein